MSRTIPELFDLSGRVAVVTGGASGLCYNMARALGEAGATLVLTSRTLDRAEKSAERLRKEIAAPVMAVSLNVTEQESIDNMCSDVLDHFGHIDILVNGAGNVSSKPGTAAFLDRPLDEWQKVIDTNLTGTFLCSQTVVKRAMLSQKKGTIVNIGSVTGLIAKDRRMYEGMPFGGSTPDYHAAKGGVHSLTREMAVQLSQYNIRVNCLVPGVFYRKQDEFFVKYYENIIPVHRMGCEEEDLGGAVVYLASDASAYVYGQLLVVDGGLTVW
ncbi:MAG: SDR family oxidoreductase [Candidatus Limivicinus sp.]